MCRVIIAASCLAATPLEARHAPHRDGKEAGPGAGSTTSEQQQQLAGLVSARGARRSLASALQDAAVMAHDGSAAPPTEGFSGVLLKIEQERAAAKRRLAAAMLDDVSDDGAALPPLAKRLELVGGSPGRNNNAAAVASPRGFAQLLTPPRCLRDVLALDL